MAKIDRAPLVSVLMAVHNSGASVRLSIESILRQTYRNLELVVVDDGSDDDTPDALRAVDDPRTTVLRQEHAGLTAALVAACNLAQGEIIARQDAGDVSEPGRIARQVEELRRIGPGLVSVQGWNIDSAGRRISGRSYPTSEAGILWALLFTNPFLGPAAAFDRVCLEEAGGYDPAYRCAQDFDLYWRIARRFPVANLRQRLYSYRIDPKGITFDRRAEQLQATDELSLRNIEEAAGAGFAPAVRLAFANLMRSGKAEPTVDPAELMDLAERLVGWLEKRCAEDSEGAEAAAREEWAAIMWAMLGRDDLESARTALARGARWGSTAANAASTWSPDKDIPSAETMRRLSEDPTMAPVLAAVKLSIGRREFSERRWAALVASCGSALRAHAPTALRILGRAALARLGASK